MVNTPMIPHDITYGLHRIFGRIAKDWVMIQPPFKFFSRFNDYTQSFTVQYYTDILDNIVA